LDSLFVFNRFLMLANDKCFTAIKDSLPSLVSPLAGISARETCNFRYDADLRTCYNNLRRKLQVNQIPYCKHRLQFVESSLYDRVLFAYSHDRRFEAKMYKQMQVSNASYASECAEALKHGMLQLLTDPLFFQCQQHIMQLFDDSTEGGLRREGCPPIVGARPCSSGPTSVCQLKVPGGRTSGMSSPRPRRRVRHGTKPYVNMARIAVRQKGP
jgi:hypothetical protein